MKYRPRTQQRSYVVKAQYPGLNPFWFSHVMAIELPRHELEKIAKEVICRNLPPGFEVLEITPGYALLFLDDEDRAAA